MILVLLVFAALVSAVGNNNSGEEQAASPATTEEEATEETAVEDTTQAAKRVKKPKREQAVAPPSPPPPASPPQTPEEAIRTNTRTGNSLLRDDLRTLDVFADPTNGCTRVRVDYETTGGMSTDFEMEEVYIAAYTAKRIGQQICRVEINAYDTVTDRYGQRRDTLVYSTHMDRSEADRINWSNPDGVNFRSIWTVDYSHPSLEAEKAKEEAEWAADCAVDEGLFDNWLCPD